MKKILIVSYFHGKECKSVSGLRTLSWAKYLIENNYQVDVCTRKWATVAVDEKFYLSDTPNTTIEILTTQNNLRHIYLPYKHKNVFDKKIMYMLSSLFGYFNNEAEICKSWKQYIQKIINQNKYDVVIASCHPYSSLKLISKLKTSAKRIIDFRDYYNNNLLNPNYKFKFLSKILFKINFFWIKQYLKNIDITLSASEAIEKKILALSNNKPSKVILNGFESEIVNYPINVNEANKKFTLIMAGRLYKVQNLDFMLNVFNSFIKANENAAIEIIFYGIKNSQEVYNYLVSKTIEYKNYYKFTSYVEREFLLNEMKRADILFYIGWRGWQGIYSGKFFEYLAMLKNILIMPSDEDVLDRIIKTTQAGKSISTEKEAVKQLNLWYKEWQEKGFLKYEGSIERISYYSRENQASYLFSFLENEF